MNVCVALIFPLYRKSARTRERRFFRMHSLSFPWDGCESMKYDRFYFSTLEGCANTISSVVVYCLKRRVFSLSLPMRKHYLSVKSYNYIQAAKHEGYTVRRSCKFTVHSRTIKKHHSARNTKPCWISFTNSAIGQVIIFFNFSRIRYNVVRKAVGWKILVCLCAK